MAKKGGYQMVVLATLTYAQALAYLECGKPLLIYDGVNKPYYADSIEVDENENVVIRKGASSIVVASDDTKTFNNVLNGALLENIVDKNGNLRFIEGEGTLSLPNGVNASYHKWSLSGTHLMIVVAGVITNTTETTAQTWYSVELPDYIFDKIQPTFSTVVQTSTENVYADDYSTQTVNIVFIKNSDTKRINLYVGAITASKDRNFRFNIDLLIDVD